MNFASARSLCFSGRVVEVVIGPVRPPYEESPAEGPVVPATSSRRPRAPLRFSPQACERCGQFWRFRRPVLGNPSRPRGADRPRARRGRQPRGGSAGCGPWVVKDLPGAPCRGARGGWVESPHPATVHHPRPLTGGPHGGVPGASRANAIVATRVGARPVRAVQPRQAPTQWSVLGKHRLVATCAAWVVGHRDRRAPAPCALRPAPDPRPHPVTRSSQARRHCEHRLPRNRLSRVHAHDRSPVADGARASATARGDSWSAPRTMGAMPTS